MNRHHWELKAEKVLKGRRVVAVRYLTEEESSLMDWSNSPVALALADSKGDIVWVYPSMDDEGNNGGALFLEGEAADVVDLHVLPVF